MRHFWPIVVVLIVIGAACGIGAIIAYSPEPISGSRDSFWHKEFVGEIDGCRVWEVESKHTKRMLITTTCKDLAK